jgi:organic radical activating enzyme
MSQDAKIKAIDSVSPSFCLAKWLQVTIDLVHGTNHSCHHPDRHQIPESELVNNPSALHNTQFKLHKRQEMLEGVRPAECEYCWKIEDTKGIHYSDRYIKSLDPWAYPYLQQVLSAGNAPTIAPTYLEVMLDKACNFSCSYCMADISSKIESEINEFGSYPMKNNTHRLPKNTNYGANEDKNPYLKAFWKWFPELIKSLHVFRITGGEPLLSKHTYRVLELFESHPAPQLTLAINTNFGTDTALLEKTLNQIEKLRSMNAIGRFEIYTSLEATGGQAEFIRYGLNEELFDKNLELALQSDFVDQIVVMGTFCILSIPSFHLLLKKVHRYKQIYPKLILDLSYLKDPEYLRANLANDTLKEMLYSSLNLMEALSNTPNQRGFSMHELNKLRRIVNWVKAGEDTEILARHKGDFALFVDEYARRKNLSFLEVFPEFKSFYLEAKKLARFHSSFKD